MAKHNYNELYKAEQELRDMNPEAVRLVGSWFLRYADKTSLKSLVDKLITWATPAQTKEQVDELRNAITKLGQDKF